jgi:hypothetical protein
MEFLGLVANGLTVALIFFLMRRLTVTHDKRFESIHERFSTHSERLRDLDRRMRDGMSRSDVRVLIDDKLEVLCVLLRELKEDVQELRKKSE